VPFHKRRRLHEHASRSAGRVVNEAVEGFDDLDNQFDDAGGRENSPPFCPSDMANLPRKYS